jgi:hypothetical protein
MIKIDEILENYPELDSSRKAELKEELLGLFSVSKRHLVQNILDDVNSCHPEYAHEKVEAYLDDGC